MFGWRSDACSGKARIHPHGIARCSDLSVNFPISLANLSALGLAYRIEMLISAHKLHIAQALLPPPLSAPLGKPSAANPQVGKSVNIEVFIPPFSLGFQQHHKKRIFHMRRAMLLLTSFRLAGLLWGAEPAVSTWKLNVVELNYFSLVEAVEPQ